MKYTDVDMPDVQSQPTVQMQSSDTVTTDRGIRRNRPSDSTNNNSAKPAPEVIDLDEEDSPKQNEEAPLTLNGVTTVRKVSLPWQRTNNLNTVDKKPSESSVESTSAECPTSERSSVSSKELTSPAEADEALSNKVIEGGYRWKKFSANECHKVVKKTSINKKDGKLVVEAKKKVVGTKLTSSQRQGERKRPSLTGSGETDPKRPKLDSGGGKSKVPSSKIVPKESERKESPKPGPKDSSEVSVVDLVEDDDDLEKVSKSKEQEKSAASKGPVGVDGHTSENKPVAMAPSKSESPVLHVEKKIPLSVSPVTATQGLTSGQSSGSALLPNVPPEEKRTSLSSIISSGKNGLITQMQSIEVKKVKLCPQLEKQATAMSAVTSMSLTPAVATPKPSTSKPKPSTGASMVHIPLPITASTPEAAEVPSLGSSKAPESVKDEVKEGEAVLLGADLEKKKGLNPVHSETRKMVKKLTRSELESFFLELACELIISRSDAGKFRQLYEEMKESCENKANKIAQLNKQLVDLSAVVHRTINDCKERRDSIPMKITRSVGLQLEQSQIFAAMKNKNREERGFVAPSAANNSISNSSSSTSDRMQSAKFQRSSSYPSSRTTPPSTPNGLIGGAGVKDIPPGAPVPTKSPQRQLRALHPRSPQLAAQGVVQAPPNPSSTSAQSPPDPNSKRLGFIDIADDKFLNSGAQIGVRRHRAPTVIVATTAGSSVSPSTALSTLSSSQVMAPALKVVPSHYAHAAAIPGNNYSQPGGNTRVVTATTIPVASGTPISSPRLTYLIPTSSPIAVQQRQLVLTSAAQSQQIRGRSPVTSMPTMLMRPNTTIVQVPSGSIATTPPTLIRAVPPSAAQQMLATKPSPQQQTPRLIGMTNRPSPASSKMVAIQHPAPLPAQPQPTVVNSNLKPIPRRPVLKLSKVLNGIVLSWNMTTTTPHEEIASYQLYAYQEGANAPPSPSLWKKVGDVKALPLPMACTLTQFADGHTYHFAVRAVDVHGRVGEFSVPGTIELFS